MVKLAWALLLLLCAWPVWAMPTYQVDKREVALGEPISLTLNVRPGGLDKLDLAPLARNFEIRNRTQSQDPGGDSLSATLYPLRIGRFSLRIPGLPGRAPSIRVDEQSNRVPQVRFRVATDPEQPLVRQPFRLTIEACDDGSLLWRHPELPVAEGLYIRKLDERQLDVMREGERCTAHRWQWRVTPTAAGAFTVPLPMLQAGKFGEQLRFPPPKVEFDVRPVPAWLPATAAVGKVSARMAALPARWPIDRPLAIRIDIDGAYTEAAVRRLLALQLNGNPAFTHYAPEVEMLAPESDSPVPRLAVTLYALPGEAGRLTLPALTLPWFDPADGRMDAFNLPAAHVEIFSPARAWMIRGGLAILAMLGLGVMAASLYWELRWRRARRRNLAAIAAAQSPRQLALALRKFRLIPDAPPAPTLAVWLVEMESGMPALRSTVSSLEGILYGAGRGNWLAIRDELLALLRHVRPRITAMRHWLQTLTLGKR